VVEAGFCHRFLPLHVNILKNTKIYYIKLLKCIKPLAHYFAKLQHPKYKGAKLSYQQKEKTIRWIALLPFDLNFNAEDEVSRKLLEEPEDSQHKVVMSEIQNLADVMTHDSSTVMPVIWLQCNESFQASDIQ